MNWRRTLDLLRALHVTPLLMALALLTSCSSEEQGDKPALYKVRVKQLPFDFDVFPREEGTFTFQQQAEPDSPQLPPLPLPWLKAIPGPGLQILEEGPANSGMTHTVKFKVVNETPEELPQWFVATQRLNSGVRIALDISGVPAGFTSQPYGYGGVIVKALPGHHSPSMEPNYDPMVPRIVVSRFMDFDRKKINITREATIDVRNAGGETLIISQVQMTNQGAAADFSVPFSWNGHNIAPKQTDRLTVYCHPRSVGRQQETLMIQSNCMSYPQVAVYLNVFGYDEEVQRFPQAPLDSTTSDALALTVARLDDLNLRVQGGLRTPVQMRGR